MNLSRHWIRRIIFERVKIAKKQVKELRKGSLLNSLSTSLQKILLSAAGISVFASPLMGASLSDIQALNDKTHIEFDEANKIYNITTSLVSSDKKNAFNAFKTFTLNSNEIANLHLPDGSQNLLNFVNSRIDIQGTVNALKNSKIGGNLYFLSSKGLILGKSGVINAGAFYAMTPHEDVMKKILTNNEVDINSNYINQIVNKSITGRNGKTKDSGIWLSSGGEIIVEGQINTINGIGLYAGGKDYENGQYTDGGILIKTGASLNTLNNFNAVVNIDGIEPDIANELIVDDGNIELVSVADTSEAKNFAEKYILGSNISKAHAKASVEVDVDANINSRKNLNIEAISTNGVLNLQYNTDRNHKYSDASNIAEISSDISIAGTLKSDASINITAVSDSNYNRSNTLLMSIAAMLLAKFTPINIDASVILNDVYTNIDISNNAKLVSSQNINIKADTYSNAEASPSSSATAHSTSAVGSGAQPYVPAAGALYFQNNAGANIDIAGSLKSDANLDVLAVSENRIHGSATANSSGSQPSVAIVIGHGENTALVNLKNSSKIDAKHDISIISKALNRNSVESVGSVNNDSYGTAAVAYSDYVSTSTVNVYTDIAPIVNTGKIKINAINDTWENTVHAETSAGSSLLSQKLNSFKDNAMNGVMQCISDKTKTLSDNAAQSASKSGSDVGYILKYLFSWLTDKIAGGTASSDPKDPATKGFSAAATVAIVDTKMKSKVYIAPDKKIVTSGDIDIQAKTIVEDLDMKAKAAEIADVVDMNNNKSGVGLAVLYTDIDHNADVIIDDNSKNLSSDKGMIQGNSVIINASVEEPYNRLQRMIYNLKWAFTILKDRFSSDEYNNIMQSLGVMEEKVENDEIEVSTKDIDSIGDFLKVAVNGASGLTTYVSDGASAVVDLIKRTFEFAVPSNYFNISVNSGSSAKKNADGKFDNLSVAGSVGINKINNESNVFIGRNRTIEAKTDSSEVDAIKIGASTNINLKSTAGSPNFILGMSSGSTGIGGSVIIEQFDANSNTVIAEGTKIISLDGSSSIYSNNEVDAMTAAFAAENAANGFDGMFSYIGGDLTANVSIDDEVDIYVNELAINTLNRNDVTNVSGAVMLSGGVGVGAGIAVTNLDRNSLINFGDNEKEWQEFRNELGLAKTGETLNQYNISATQYLNQLKATSKTSGTINTIGVAGGISSNSNDNGNGKSGGVSGFFSGLLSIPDKLADTVHNAGVNVGKKIGGNNVKDSISKRNIPESQSSSGKLPNFSLSVAGSVALNIISANSSVLIDKADFIMGGKGSIFDASTIDTAKTFALAGSVGIMSANRTTPESQQSKSAAVDGAVGLNFIDN